jgi:hypothetical protein
MQHAASESLTIFCVRTYWIGRSDPRGSASGTFCSYALDPLKRAARPCHIAVSGTASVTSAGLAIDLRRLLSAEEPVRLMAYKGSPSIGLPFQKVWC